MAFSYTRDKVVQGVGARVVCGTYTNSGSETGGDIATGLAMTYALILQPYGSSVSGNQPVVNETLPKSGACTVVTSAGEDGTWIAVGV